VLSRTSEYVLRALIYLARHEGERPIPGRTIAADANIPAKYLSNILGVLVRQGVLESSPGRTGGFTLARPPEAIRLLDVLGPFETFHVSRCPFGNRECSDDNPCLAHPRWKQVKQAEIDFLTETSVRDVAFRANGGPVSR
jgi:Rrf2 family protein